MVEPLDLWVTAWRMVGFKILRPVTNFAKIKPLRFGRRLLSKHILTYPDEYTILLLTTYVILDKQLNFSESSFVCKIG